MCGIAGIVGTHRVNRQAVDAMVARLTHRGPDGDGIWQSDDGLVCFGHRRLAIIDLKETGAQPMHSADGRYTITYNGEIYNYVELRQELEQAGRSFQSTSDTEVLIEAYAVWGERCVERLNGMFAFALYDHEQNLVFCARDRLGEKPFLYHVNGNAFVFASEYRAMFAVEGVDPSPREDRLVAFALNPTAAIDQTQETLFDSVSALPAAHTLIYSLNDQSTKIRRYWDPMGRTSFDASDMSDNFLGAAETFGALVEDAVKLRLRSDVKVGSCLSGGLDSSAITGIARRLQGEGEDYNVFTGRFPNSPSDEGEWSKLVVKKTSALSHQAVVTDAAFFDEIDDFISGNELPLDSASQFAQWCVFREAADNGVKVLLDGQGADEILGGYEQYFAGYLNSVPVGERLSEEKQIDARYPGALHEHRSRWKQKLPLPVKRLVSRVLGRGTSMALGFSNDALHGVPMEAADVGVNDLHAMLLRDTCHGFLPTLLRYGDRNSMAHSVEVRLPFCDHRIVEFAFAQPAAFLMGEAQTKRLIREGLKGDLPEAIRTRWRKQGFMPPMDAWLRGALAPVIDGVMASESFRKRGMWDVGWWSRAVERFRSGDAALAAPIWKMIMIERWFDAFVGNVSKIPTYPIYR